MLVTRISAALVAVVAGYVSYLHIVDVAMDVGERREVAYALPVTIDALMVMSTLAMLAARRAGRKPSSWAYCGFLFGVAVSVTANVASAAPTWPARAVAAIPAVSLLLAVEVLIRATAYQPATEPAQPADEPPAPPPPPAPSRPAAPRPAVNGSDGHGRKGGRKRRGEAGTAAAGVLAAHPDAPVAELARLAGVSRATVRRARTNGTDSHAGGARPVTDRSVVASTNHQ
nr:DUF2637 domain-containing protein [Micromonospora tarapacensis]